MASRARPEPREHPAGWPEEACEDPAAERARLFVLNLRGAMGHRTLRDVGAIVAVDHTTLSRILDGHAWPDGYTIARLEVGLGVRLWPAFHG